MTQTLEIYIGISAVLFCLGLYTALTRRNAVRFLMGIELILNSASLNFVAFSRFVEGGLGGQMVSIFIIILAAAEAAVALAIILNIYRHLRAINIDQATTMSDFQAAPDTILDALLGRRLR